MYAIEFSNRGKKSLLKYNHSGSFPQKKFRATLSCLREGKSLPSSYKDHSLKGSLQNYRELHLAGDILVQYEVDLVLKIITISKIGTHAELFGE
ncbi:MAG TPA: type II toxin-antitoxin system YafQ family toxin [Candidatus Paceibacterota bacterium]